MTQQFFSSYQELLEGKFYQNSDKTQTLDSVVLKETLNNQGKIIFYSKIPIHGKVKKIQKKFIKRDGQYTVRDAIWCFDKFIRKIIDKGGEEYLKQHSYIFKIEQDGMKHCIIWN